MSDVARTRQNWRCPSCGRKYRIGAGAPKPAMCPECAEEEKALAAKGPGVVKKELSLSKAQSAEPVVTTKFFAPGDAGPPPEEESSTPPPSTPASSAADEPLLTRAEIDEALDHLANISRTMTIIRRSLALCVLISLVSVVAAGCFIWKLSRGTIDQVQHAVQAFQQPLPAPQPQPPPQPQQQQPGNIQIEPNPQPQANHNPGEDGQQDPLKLLRTLLESLDRKE